MCKCVFETELELVPLFSKRHSKRGYFDLIKRRFTRRLGFIGRLIGAALDHIQMADAL